MKDINLQYQELTPADFDKLIVLANHVHGDGYLDKPSLQAWYEKGIKHHINASYVVYHDEKLVGFRISYAAGNWHIDKWSTPELWKTPTEQVSYFKCNTVDENYRGYGIGGKLLAHSIEALKKQGSAAGTAHLWKQSPNNSAVRYFTKCGGVHVKAHPDKWREEALAGYDCIICGFDCHCEAAEMIIYFD